MNPTPAISAATPSCCHRPMAALCALAWWACLTVASSQASWANDLAGGKPRNWSALISQQSLLLPDTPAGMQRLATAVVLENLPETYEDDRDWGGTRERFDGLHVRLDGLQVRTKRKRKTVNHGTWKYYRITQIAPEKNLRVSIGPVRTADDGRAAFSIELASQINGVARLAEWNRGVRLLSVTLDADAKVRILLDCRLDVQLDPTHFPPDVVLKPEVVDAQLHVDDFRVNRISHFDGPVAREMGGALEKLLQRKVDDKRPHLVAKINRQIERHQADLRISLHDSWRKRWHDFEQGAAEGSP